MWLCSWYPSQNDRYNGDFIQRHARAASLYADVHVLYVDGVHVNGMPEVKQSREQKDNLTESILLFRKSHTRIGRLLAHYRWRKHYKRAIRNYIKENGLPDLVHVHVPMKAGMMALWMNRKFRIPFIVTEHWGIYNETEVLNFSGRSAVFRQLTRRIFSAASAFTSVSHFLAQGVNRLVMKKEYEIIPNVVDTNQFTFAPQISNRPFTFLHVSNMVPLKNVAGILRAFQRFINATSNDSPLPTPGYRLVLVGNRDGSMEDLARGMNLPGQQVQFRGEIAYEDVAKEMQQADCLVLFSDIENAPCVISEAHCCGLPVIASEVGGIPEMVNASNGILVNPKDEEGLADAMRDMIETGSRFDRATIAKEAQKRYAYEIVGKQFADLYTKAGGQRIKGVKRSDINAK